tara:strand:+ start:899 stop:1345 length:447 start_codon:yes stop_codon:yes gene_type:complete
MALNEEYLRLNLYKKPTDAIRNLEVQTEPFATDLHYNIFTKGEVNDYDAINVSITNILLTSVGELLFNLGFGSSMSRALFSQIAEESIAEELLDILIQEVEAIETRINIVTNQARLNIKPDSNSMEIELPYVLKQSGLTSLYKQRISI